MTIMVLCALIALICLREKLHIYNSIKPISQKSALLIERRVELCRDGVLLLFTGTLTKRES